MTSTQLPTFFDNKEALIKEALTGMCMGISPARIAEVAKQCCRIDADIAWREVQDMEHRLAVIDDSRELTALLNNVRDEHIRTEEAIELARKRGPIPSGLSPHEERWVRFLTLMVLREGSTYADGLRLYRRAQEIAGDGPEARLAMARYIRHELYMAWAELDAVLPMLDNFKLEDWTPEGIEAYRAKAHADILVSEEFRRMWVRHHGRPHTTANAGEKANANG